MNIWYGNFPKHDSSCYERQIAPTLELYGAYSLNFNIYDETVELDFMNTKQYWSAPVKEDITFKTAIKYLQKLTKHQKFKIHCPWSTVKPVYNDHLMGYFSAFWSSSRWPRAT